MNDIIQTRIEKTLRQLVLHDGQEPFPAPLGDFQAVRSVEVDGNKAKVGLAFGFPCEKALDGYCQEIKEQLQQSFPELEIEIDAGWFVPEPRVKEGVGLVKGVTHIIAVASGKGGVGKSTTATNLALALQQEGATVGILDADIYGPSQPLLLGVPESQRPEMVGNQIFRPIVAHGLQSMSIGYLVTEKTPMVWRGPMVSGALQQLLGQTQWQGVDYLIIDMPPGTGDIQLTLSQRVPVTGAVIVTTPQDIALLDAKKGVEMFRKVHLPVLGVVENMSVHICSKCGHQEPIFGEGGAAKIASEYGTTLLGSLPLSMNIRSLSDAGKPVVMADEEGAIAASYQSIARKMAAALALSAHKGEQKAPSISIVDD